MVRRTVHASVAPQELGFAALARELLRVDDRLRGVVLRLIQRGKDTDRPGSVVGAPSQTARTFVARDCRRLEEALLAEGRLLGSAS